MKPVMPQDVSQEAIGPVALQAYDAFVEDQASGRSGFTALGL